MSSAVIDEAGGLKPSGCWGAIVARFDIPRLEGVREMDRDSIGEAGLRPSGVGAMAVSPDIPRIEGGRSMP